jgi:hypothetical protein
MDERLAIRNYKITVQLENLGITGLNLKGGNW